MSIPLKRAISPYAMMTDTQVAISGMRSNTSCQIRPGRLAPSANRIAKSRVLSNPETNSRLATFAMEQNSIRPEAASKI